MQIILIDASYFIFYRIYALHIWWKNAKPGVPLENAYLNTEFVEKFKSTFKEKITEIKKKLKMKEAKIIVGKDCPRDKIWRNKLIEGYKGNRNDEKNKTDQVGEFFSLAFKESLFIEGGVDEILEYDGLEADDCIALYTKKLLEKMEAIEIKIITSDHDYIQLANEKVELFNLKYKNLLESKSSSGDPKRDLFDKILLGDKSDNICGVFKKCGKKTLDMLYENEEELKKKLCKEGGEEILERNKKLIMFENIPLEYQEGFYNKYNI